MKFIERRTLLLALALTSVVSPALAASALSILDTDKDGTVDLDEAKAAATKLFDELDVDHDGTLDRKELKGRISDEDWKIADPDNDKTISKAEYLAFIEVAFKRANPDNDGSIDAKELKSPAGRALPHAVEGSESGNQFAEFGGRLLHGSKVATQLLRNSGPRRFDNLRTRC